MHSDRPRCGRGQFPILSPPQGAELQGRQAQGCGHRESEPNPLWKIINEFLKKGMSEPTRTLRVRQEDKPCRDGGQDGSELRTPGKLLLVAGKQVPGQKGWRVSGLGDWDGS